MNNVERLTREDLTAAVQAAVASARDNANSAWLELAATLRRPQAVQIVPSDRVTFIDTTVPAGPTTQLVPAHPERARLWIWTGADDVYLSSREGALSTDTDCMYWNDAVPLLIQSRAAIYATGGASSSRVRVVVEYADQEW